MYTVILSCLTVQFPVTSSAGEDKKQEYFIHHIETESLVWQALKMAEIIIKRSAFSYSAVQFGMSG